MPRPALPTARASGAPGRQAPPADGPTSARARTVDRVGGRGPGRSGLASAGAELDAGPAVRARLGDPEVDRETFAAMSVLLAAEHLSTVMAKQRGLRPRDALIAEAADLLLGTEDPGFVRRVLATLAEQERVLDIYPLEILAYCLDRRPDLLDTHRFTPFVLNRKALASTIHRVEEPIRLELPLSATMKAMALVGGASPGYHLYPGAPAEYVIELGSAGQFTFLLRAEVRRESVIDRITLTVADDGLD